MTTYPTLKIVKGTRSIDLNDRVNFYLRPDFVPPETNQATQIATGSALNMAGGRVVARKPQTRTWTFSVRVVGTTDADIVNQLRGVKTLLSEAGDANEPVKIQYKPNSDTPEPLWGQFGALLNYEVLSGRITIGPDYMKGARRAKAVTATFELTIQPYALGKQQRVCSALGGISEDTLGVVDGRSRGLVVATSTTNLFTNPVFGNATWDTGWTAGSKLIASLNTDKRFVSHGSRSARLTATAAADNTFIQSITLTAGARMIWAIIKLIDSGVPSSSDVQITYDGTDRTTTFTEIGDGFYFAEAGVTGTGGAAAAGITVKNGHTLFLCAMQAEAKGYRSPLCYGDLLGCAWTGTAHASTSTRTAGVCKLSTGVEFAARPPITIRVAFKTQEIPAAHNVYLIDLRDGTYADAPYVYLPSGDNHLIAAYNGNAFDGQALTANTWYVMHLVIEATGSLTLYVNASAADSATAAGLADFGAYLRLGSTYSDLHQADTNLAGMAVFETALTAAQVAADYANAAAVLADGARLESIPWLWTKDGDNIVDNCNDSTRDNWCVVGGVPGSAPAKTLLNVTVSGLDTNLLLGLNAVKDWVDPAGYLYADYSGTADANSSGGEYQNATIDTSGLVPFTVLTIQDNPMRWAAFSGREFMALLRLYDVGASQVNYRFRPYGAAGYNFDNNQTLSAAWQIARLLPFRTLRKADVGGDETGENISITLVPKRATGSADIRLDYVMLMPRPLVSIASPFSSASPSLLIDGLNAVEYLPAFSNRFMIPKPTVTGDAIELIPESLNTLLANAGATITRTVTFNAIKVTPRWELV